MSEKPLHSRLFLRFEYFNTLFLKGCLVGEEPLPRKLRANERPIISLPFSGAEAAASGAAMKYFIDEEIAGR